MSSINCSSCNDLKNNSSDFATNGVTTAVCTSLKNDTGFSTSNNHNDCTDLDLANDCLIGNMEAEIEKYDMCDWKEFMQDFISNTHTVLKAMICAICGIWTNIHQLWDEINALKARVKAIEDWIEDTLKPWMASVNSDISSLKNRVTSLETWQTTINTWKTQIDTWKTQINTWKTQVDTWKNTTVPATYLTKEDAANTYETKSDGATKNYVNQQINNNNAIYDCKLQNITEAHKIQSYSNDKPSGTLMNNFRLAGGISLRSGEGLNTPMITVRGTTARITGALKFDGNMPSSYRSGGSSSPVPWLDFYDGGTDVTNTAGNSSYKGNTPEGNFLIYEFECDPTEYGISDFYLGNMFSIDGGDFLCRMSTVAPGDKYPYDYGLGVGGAQQTYNNSNPNMRLIQVRLVNMRTWGVTRNHGEITPTGTAMAIPMLSKGCN